MLVELHEGDMANVGLAPREAFEPEISAGDRRLLRELARRVAEIGHLAIMDERRALWKKHNALRRVRPMLLVFPEGAWRELLPASALRCERHRARAIEWSLRQAIYYHDHLHDDTVIEPFWVVRKQVTVSHWGLEPRRIPSHQATGAWAFDPVIHTPDDLNLLHAPTVTYDAQATEQEQGLMQDLFGDVLPVQLRGIGVISFHLMAEYTALRGLEQVMVDMIDAPDMLHRAMAILEAGYREVIGSYQQLGLLQLNNDGEYHSSGGVTYTDELPAPGYEGGAPRLCDLWASAEADRSWEEIEKNLQKKTFGTSTRVRLGFPPSQLLSPDFGKFIDEQVIAGPRYGRMMASRSDRDDFGPPQNSEESWFVDELQVMVSRYDKTSRTHENEIFRIGVGRKDFQGTDVVDIDSHLEFEEHVKFVEALIKQVSPSDSPKQ